jgi:cell wall-associated NlpC family hydrolase
MPISGTAVAAAGIGGFLVYAGIQDVDLVTGIRQIVSGQTPTPRVATPTADWSGLVATAAFGVSAASGGSLVAEAQKHLGAKYVFGAVGPSTFDCSGLVVFCLRKTLYPQCPRFVTQTFSLWARSQGFVKVARSSVQAGDIVLKSGHMGIAISNADMIHAPHTGTVVKVGAIYNPAYMWSGWRPPQQLAAGFAAAGTNNAKK